MIKSISSFSLYRFRYLIGYGFIGLTLIGLLVYAGLFVPGGISSREVTSVIASSDIKPLEFASYGVVDMPYHILQKISLSIFGVSNFSIKLPSLILALISSVSLLILLRMWFKKNIALLGSAIAITTGQFLFIAQSGTPDILYIFWPVILLLLGMLIVRNKRYRTIWKMLFFAIAAMSLYTPLSIYALIALFSASILHPHLRYTLKNLSKLRLAISMAIGLVIVSPLIFGLTLKPELLLTLLGIPSQLPDFSANISEIFQNYLGFANPSTTELMTPAFGLGSMLLIIMGGYIVLKTRASTQSYIIIIWLVCLLPVIFLEPSHTSITFIPLVLLLSAGLGSLINYWYRLFPRNPYARIAGLIPVIILVSSLIFSGLDRYVSGYTHDPKTVANFSKDLSLIPKQTKQLIVSADELPFYNVVQKYNKSISVNTEPTESEFVSTKAANRDFNNYKLDRIITSSLSNDSDRLYSYKIVE